MSSISDPRERVRHWSIVAYLVMLVLLLPLTLFVIKQEQQLNTKAASIYGSPVISSTAEALQSQLITPTYGVIVPCPSCGDTPVSVVPSAAAVYPTTVADIPVVASPAIAPADDPCVAEDNHKKRHQKAQKGAINNFTEAILKFLIDLILLLLQFITGGEGEITNPSLVPKPANPCDPATAQPINPLDPNAPANSLTPAPNNPQSTIPTIDPNNPIGNDPNNPFPGAPDGVLPAPTNQPFTTLPTPLPKPAVFTPVSTPGPVLNPQQVAPQQPANCIQSGQKCDPTGARQCCTLACTQNINPNFPNDPGTCD